MNKQANIQKAIALMKSKGMSAEKALRAVYPDWDDSKIQKAAMTIRTMDKTAAVMQVSSAMEALSKTASEKKKKMTFSPAMDDSPLLRGKQSRLPDQIQAKILKGKMKKEKPVKDKVASPSLIGLQYASNAMYTNHIVSKTGKIKQANFLMRALGVPSVSQYATRGAIGGGLLGGGAEAYRMADLLSDAGRAAHTKNLAKYTKAEARAAAKNREVQRMLPGQKAKARKGQIAFGNNAKADDAFIKRFDELKGMGGFKANPGEYIKLFAPSIMKNMGAGAAAGGAAGAGVAQIGKMQAKRKMVDTAKKYALPAAVGVGGLAMLSS